MTVIILLVGGLLLLGCVVLGARHIEARTWRQSLVAYRLRPPGKLTRDDVATWLSMIAADTQPPRWSLLPLPPLGIEIVAEADGITYVVLVPKPSEAKLLSSVRAGLPGASLEELPDYFEETCPYLVAGEATLTSRHRPLAVERAEATNAAFLASLQPLGDGEEVRLQVFVASAGTPEPVHTASPKPEDHWWAAYLLEGEAPADADTVRATRTKQSSPLLQVSIRLGVRAASRERAYVLFGRTWSVLHGMNAPGVRLVRRWLPSDSVAGRMLHYALPLALWPVLANTKELTGLIGLPIAGVALPGVTTSTARQLPPSPAVPSNAAVVGVSNYPGMENRRIALKANDRLRHIWALGPIGTGKSTWMANLIEDDMRRGRGVVVIDPKGDLITDVLDRVPEHRQADVVVLDPSFTDRPVGLNILDLGSDEHARELAVDQVVHVMASLWQSSFGPRTADVLRNALLTLTHTRAADGSAHTLIELPELLTNPSFRRFVTGQPTVPASVRPFWFAYEQMSDNERAQVIGPSMNKLRSFTTRSSLRLLLGQSSGIRLSDIYTKRRILLVPLPAGRLGSETVSLAGSLLMAGLWQATQARVNVPRERRHPVFFYLDEFHMFMRLNVDLAEMAAVARGYGAGLVLAHQFLSQLTPDMRAAVLGTVRTQALFSLELDDARALAPRFAPLTADDLTGLATYDIALRPCVDGSTLSPVTAHTLPLGPATADGAAVAATSRERYGVPRAEVEAAIKARITPPGTAGSTAEFGRRKRGGKT
jgi:hypothetical protein